MAAIDQTSNTDFDICFARGDNDPKTFTITDSAGVAVDISSWTMRMAVNTDINPASTSTEVFAVAGTFATDGTDGKIVFTPTGGSLDNVEAPGVAFYDVSRVTPSKKTLIKGRVVLVMDIDKG